MADTPDQPTSPDCAQGKHTACDGAAWNHTTDEAAPCECACHATKLAPEPVHERTPRGLAHTATVRPNDVEIDGIPIPWLIANDVSIDVDLASGNGLKRLRLAVYVDGDVILEGDRA